MPKLSSDVAKYAQFGAAMRLQQLNAEEKAILAAFPDLRRGAKPERGRKPKHFSAEARAKMAAAQRRRWAEWRNAKSKA